MGDCSRHKKEVAGITDMEELAEMVGDLHYETLVDFFDCLCDKLENDSIKDRTSGRKYLANVLHLIALQVRDCKDLTKSAWKISEPFMNQ